jgi:hypothetical protein
MEMEMRILQMLELLLARQEEAAARQEKAHADAKALQEKAEADAKAGHEKDEADVKACHEEAAARQEKATAELKAAILASFRESMTCQTETTSSSEEMEATNLEATLEATEAAAERQKLRENEINVDNIVSSEDRSGYQRLAV